MDDDRQHCINDTRNNGKHKRLHCGWITIICISLMILAFCATNFALLLKFVVLASSQPENVSTTTPKQSGNVSTTTTTPKQPSELSSNACI
jgi:cytoskeletal protein RodZ